MIKVYKGGGITLGTVILVVFLTLKLAGVIAWSWWWVLAPLWIPASLALLLLAFLGLMTCAVFSKRD